MVVVVKREVVVVADVNDDYYPRAMQHIQNIDFSSLPFCPIGNQSLDS